MVLLLGGLGGAFLLFTDKQTKKETRRTPVPLSRRLPPQQEPVELGISAADFLKEESLTDVTLEKDLQVTQRGVDETLLLAPMPIIERVSDSEERVNKTQDAGLVRSLEAILRRIDEESKYKQKVRRKFSLTLVVTPHGQAT